MKAVVVREFGPVDLLEYTDQPDPQAAPAQVVIETEAIGVNFPDGLMVQGLYQSRPQTPFVPGMEVAGRVIATGEGVEGFKVGDRVASFCKQGAYAEKIVVPAAAAMKLPDHMPAAHACALLCGYGTSHHALKQRGQLKPGETLCVLGASGLTGTAAIQIGKVMGARVIAVASSPVKQEIARQAGADIVFGYDNLRENLKRATDGEGVDVAFDPVGGPAFDVLSRAMAWEGRLLVVGFASGEIPKLPVNLPLLKGYAVVGVIWGTFTEKQPGTYQDNMRELLGWYDEGKITPVIEGEYPLSEAATVLERILRRGATGKLILKP